MASEQRILDRFYERIRERGLVGERQLACLTYLVITSRLLDKPVSLAVKGESSGGKSFTVEETTAFFPSDALYKMTGMSEKALIYDDTPVAHRTLLLYEYVALKTGLKEDQTSYFVRSLLSEGVLRYPVTEKQHGKFRVRVVERQGPTNLIVTTTELRLHPENETRAFSVTVDDSREQTQRVLEALAEEDRDLREETEWIKLQNWLASTEPRVTIPYGKALSKQIPPVATRLRRDFGALLFLIRSHAVLHQATRERDEQGQIIASLDDYAVVRELVVDVMSEGVGQTVSDTVRATVAAVEELGDPEGVTASAVAKALDLDPSAARRRLLTAAMGGYVRNLEDRPRRPGRYVVGEPMPEEIPLLPYPEHLPTNCLLEADEPAGQAEDARWQANPRG